MSNLGFWPVDVVKTVITRPSLTSHLSGWATRFKNSSKAVAGLGIAAIGEIRGGGGVVVQKWYGGFLGALQGTYYSDSRIRRSNPSSGLR